MADATKAYSEPALRMVYGISTMLVQKLRLNEEPLVHLPLAVWRPSDRAKESYVFPTCSGKWAFGQKATEASVFLVNHLLQHHAQLLQPSQCLLLSSSVPAALSVLRCLKPSLPGQHDIMRAHACAAHRLAFCDGWLDTTTLDFHPLPFKPEHMVFAPTIPFCYAELMQVRPSETHRAMGMLCKYLPEPSERDWLLRYLGRCLCPADGCKHMVFFVDSMERAAGNAGKSTLLSWLQSALGEVSCPLQSGQALTVAQSHSLHLSSPLQPVVQIFDELSRCNSRCTARQLDYGALKFLCNGRRSQPAAIIAANLRDIPNFAELLHADPAFVNRLVCMPGRARFVGSTTPGLQSKLDSLSKALAAILLKSFCEYKASGNQLLEIPLSMQSFKQLVLRSSVLGSIPIADVMDARNWLMATVSCTCNCQDACLPVSLVRSMFVVHKGATMKAELAYALLDATLASCGILLSEDTCHYIGVSWLGTSNA
jgi:hypothetical protein